MTAHLSIFQQIWHCDELKPPALAATSSGSAIPASSSSSDPSPSSTASSSSSCSGEHTLQPALDREGRGSGWAAAPPSRLLPLQTGPPLEGEAVTGSLAGELDSDVVFAAKRPWHAQNGSPKTLKTARSDDYQAERGRDRSRHGLKLRSQCRLGKMQCRRTSTT